VLYVLTHPYKVEKNAFFVRQRSYGQFFPHRGNGGSNFDPLIGGATTAHQSTGCCNTNPAQYKRNWDNMKNRNYRFSFRSILIYNERDKQNITMQREKRDFF
jgi:hypothetical protein